MSRNSARAASNLGALGFVDLACSSAVTSHALVRYSVRICLAGERCGKCADSMRAYVRYGGN